MDYKNLTLSSLSRRFREIRAGRKKQAKINREAKIKRMALTQTQRRTVLAKTDGRCHICGGPIEGRWQVDHVMAHSAGGSHSVDNYLPAHSICNNYRWHYSAEEFQWILKLGVFAKTKLESPSGAWVAVGEEFVKKERQRHNRRKQS